MYWLGFRRREVLYSRLPREHGRSAWSLRRRVHYMLDSTFAFSYLPIRLMELTGMLDSFSDRALDRRALCEVAERSGSAWLHRHRARGPVFRGSQRPGIGPPGRYVWRAFENTKGRPPYVVARCLHFGEGKEAAK